MVPRLKPARPVLLRFCDSNLSAGRQGKKPKNRPQTITQDATSPTINSPKNIHKCGIVFPLLHKTAC